MPQDTLPGRQASLARVYTMKARSGAGDELEAALKALAAIIRGKPGCAGIELMRNATEPDCLLFVERWISEAAYAEGAKTLSKEAFAPVMSAVDGRPDAGTFRFVPME